MNFKIEDVTDNVAKNDTINDTINDTKNDPRLLKLLKVLNKNHEINRKELSNILSVSESSISRYIKKLQEDRRIERVGSRKKGYWKILK